MSEKPHVIRRNRLFALWLELGIVKAAEREGLDRKRYYEIIKRHPDYAAAVLRQKQTREHPLAARIRELAPTHTRAGVLAELGISLGTLCGILHRHNIRLVPTKGSERAKRASITRWGHRTEEPASPPEWAQIDARRPVFEPRIRIPHAPRALPPREEPKPMIIAAPTQIQMPLPPPVVAAAPIQLPPPAFRSCQWPSGTRWNITFCGCADVEPGKPYCLKHCRAAYVDYPARGRVAA